jgi:hypothetical protein
VVMVVVEQKKIEEFCFAFDDVEDGILGFVA